MMLGYRLYKDGDMWCAVAPGFIDINSSPAGFGETKGEAIQDLAEDSHSMARRIKTTTFDIGGFCHICKEWVSDGLSMDGCRDPNCPCQ